MHTSRIPKYRDPVRREKIRQSKLGKPRPKHVVAALVAVHKGTKWTEQKRQQMLEARMKRHPRCYELWTDDEDELVRTLSIREAAMRTGRSEKRVIERRKVLGVGRNAGHS